MVCLKGQICFPMASRGYLDYKKFVVGVDGMDGESNYSDNG